MASSPMSSRASCILLASLLFCNVALASFNFINEATAPGGATSTARYPQPWLRSAAAGWMGKIPGHIRLNRISIPGTHDTGAIRGNGWCKTQTMSVYSQLKMGIRFLDIRVRLINNEFRIFHGVCDMRKGFGPVMGEVASFLREAPNRRETIVMRMKKEDKVPDSRYAAVWKSRYSRTYGFLFSTVRPGNIPKLSEVRGKVVIMWNIANVSPTGLNYGRDSEIQDFFRVHTFPWKNGVWGRVSAWYKRQKIRELIGRAPSSSKMVLNYLSASSFIQPLAWAKQFNQYTYTFLGDQHRKRILGVLIMDYPGDRLVYRILKSNFASSKPVESSKFCKGRTFRFESRKTWVEFRLPQSKVGTVIVFKGGAYGRFSFPRCYRVRWDDQRMFCQSDQTWKQTGKTSTDIFCHSRNRDQKYLHYGKK